MTEGLALSYEVVDELVLIALKDQRSYLQKELKDYENGSWLHSEDVVKNQELIKCLDTLIKYYGG